MHSTFQGLSACYKAPEADKLFATTQPVETKSDAFADDLEKVTAALSAYAGEVKPLVKRLENLKSDAIDFVSSVEGDDDWRKDKKKVDRNNELVRGVNAAVSAFQAAERTCHDKIVALVGGKPLVVDDGSHKPNMYGYKANDLNHAEKLPWGSMAQREYTGLRWLGHQIKSFVWDGFVVDGIWGTIKGLGTLVGTEGWDKAGQAWTGLAKLSTGLVISTTPLAAAYWMAPEKKLPKWLRTPARRSRKPARRSSPTTSGARTRPAPPAASPSTSSPPSSPAARERRRRAARSPRRSRYWARRAGSSTRSRTWARPARSPSSRSAT
ncbi:hypothetical protein [Streptomyces sp. NPDC021096]|uniref:hypothetical protein n=1 Tax=Streptomyces sp. NPDC021096 TaxID=3154792 RepID=UPI0033FA73F7